jgi:stalled ribosome alternative rescue factor ArfA
VNVSIGTRSESSLHRTLKFRYSAGGKTEEAVAGFIADGINGDGEYIEVQTGSFAPLKKKLALFTSHGRVIIIHPIIINKIIDVYDKKGKRLYRRKSPRHGSEWDLFNNLVYAPQLALLPYLSIELAIIDAVEKRIRDGKGSWRRRGISLYDRELEAWHGSLCLNCPDDYRRFVPFKPGEDFTTDSLAKKAGINAGLAQKTLYVLTKISVVSRTGKKGRSWIYNLATSRPTYHRDHGSARQRGL